MRHTVKHRKKKGNEKEKRINDDCRTVNLQFFFFLFQTGIIYAIGEFYEKRKRIHDFFKKNKKKKEKEKGFMMVALQNNFGEVLFIIQKKLRRKLFKVSNNFKTVMLFITKYKYTN